MAKNNTKSVLIEIKSNAVSLTKKDIGTWRKSWQMALNPENPQRYNLLNVYRDVSIDNHVNGCIMQRKGFVKNKSFKIVDKNGIEKEEITELFGTVWFKDFIDYALDSIYYGHSLIELGEIIDGVIQGVNLIPRENVIPEYGVIVREVGDEPSKGISYREGQLANWCVECGKSNDLGLLLKVSPPAISKKNMMAYWDIFGEVFGMPIRIAKTSSRDQKEIDRTEKFLKEMGASSYGLFPEGTELQVVETTRGDAFNVYDRRIERCNSEVSKSILGQTMTIDDGSSLSQSSVHLEVLKNIIESDADFLKDIINGKLIPIMRIHGVIPEGYSFKWNDLIEWTPEQQLQIEQMLLNSYEIDPEYFATKYNIKILGKKQQEVKGADLFFA